MKPTLEDIREITDAYDACWLECDGLTNVLHFYLAQASIPHAVMWGQVEDERCKDGIDPHVWIEIETMGGTAIVDYRARMWLGEHEHVPHGVFLKVEYSWMHYQGNEIEPVNLPEDIIRVLADKY